MITASNKYTWTYSILFSALIAISILNFMIEKGKSADSVDKGESTFFLSTYDSVYPGRPRMQWTGTCWLILHDLLL